MKNELVFSQSEVKCTPLSSSSEECFLQKFVLWKDSLHFQVSFLICACVIAIFAVNNAGVSLLTILDCVPMELAKETFDINFFGTLRLINAVLPSMKARESGHIINNSSVFGVIGAPFFEIYCASKFAVEGLTESLVPTLKHFNIR